MKRCLDCRRHMRKEEARCPFCGTTTRESFAVAAIVVGVMSVACGPSVAVDSDDGSSSGSGTPTSVSTPQPTTAPQPTTQAPTQSGTMSDPSTTTFDTDSETNDVETSVGFIYGSATEGPLPFECDPWDQDCPDGEKCAAWANDGGNVWNATKCVPLDPNPDLVGDVCFVEGSGVSGVDTCEKFAMCFYVDNTTNVGECVALCQGSEADPICDDAAQSCFIAGDGSLTICLDSCDPIAQSCAEPQACMLYLDQFFCLPVAEPALIYGDPCEFTNSCPAGLTCIAAESVPSCNGAVGGCCTQFCDPSLPMADESCPDFDQGQTCVAIEGTPYGVCAVEA